MKNDSTIVAVSTGFPAAIAVIRLSGERALSLLDSCFICNEKAKHRYLRVGKIKAEDISDTATAVFFKAPFSYTGEDMAEISIHGSAALASKMVKFLIKSGAKAADRGEFTKRAFLNGKLDLSSAEGVLNIINAQTDTQLRAAYSQLQGEIRHKIEGLQKSLTALIAKTEAAIDFPEEDLEEETKADIILKTNQVLQQINILISSFNQGRLIKEGIRVVLTGGVNVGKSSLLNALLGHDRAIVSDIAGTTRDTVEDSYQYNGYKFIVIDTAGLRKSEGEIEKQGINRSLLQINKSDIALAVSQAGQPPSQKTLTALKDFKGTIIRVQNKIDILQPINDGSVMVSALTGNNIDKLKQLIFDKAMTTQREGLVITDFRHYQALTEAAGQLTAVLKDINGITMDCIAAQLMAAYNSLGSITGVVGSDEVIAEIFSNFCVGK